MYRPPTISSSVNLSTIEEVLPERYRKYNCYIGTVCPFHDDSTPSLMIYEDGYRCLACGVRGSLEALYNFYKSGRITTVKSHRKVTQERFVNPFTEWTKHETLYSVLIKNYKRLQAFPKSADYLQKRGLLIDTLYKLGIGYFDGWFTVPVFDNLGNLLGGVARAGLDIQQSIRYVLSEGISAHLYVPSYKRINKAGYAFVTFGILDAVTLNQLGFPAISTLFGKGSSFTLFDSFRCRLLFLPDLGEEKEAQSIASRLDWRGKYIHFPYGKFGNSKDMNDCLQYDATALQSTLLELQG